MLRRVIRRRHVLASTRLYPLRAFDSNALQIRGSHPGPDVPMPPCIDRPGSKQRWASSPGSDLRRAPRPSTAGGDLSLRVIEAALLRLQCCSLPFTFANDQRAPLGLSILKCRHQKKAKIGSAVLGVQAMGSLRRRAFAHGRIPTANMFGDL